MKCIVIKGDPCTPLWVREWLAMPEWDNKEYISKYRHLKEQGLLEDNRHYGVPAAIILAEAFRALFMKVREKERKSNAGAKPYDVVLMFKALIIQSLYNLSDDELEYQILDRLTFMRISHRGCMEKSTPR